MARRFDGSPTRMIPIRSGDTSFSEDTGGQSSCYRLVAYSGPTPSGSTQEICTVPGIGFFSAGTESPVASTAVERLPIRLEGTPLR